MKNIFKKLLFIIIFCLATVNLFAAPTYWQQLAPGLEYTELNSFSEFSFSNLHAFRFDLHRYQLQLAFTKDRNDSPVSVASLVAINGAVVGVNGGFFSPDLKPLGLRIIDGEVKNPLKPTTWWGVFYTRGNRAYIVKQNSYKADNSINFAVQSGPRLLFNGKAMPFKPGIANRTALGITKDGKVVLVVTDHLPLSLAELADIMGRSSAEGGLDCVNALNLDGGSSTQLFAQLGSFHVSVPSFFPVTDAVLVVPKKT